MSHITKIKLNNFRRFQEMEIVFNDKINVLVGDNESGKSSILKALDLVISGSRHKVERIGIESLFNHQIIAEFLKGGKAYEDLPVILVEVFLDEQNLQECSGKNNSEDVDCDGLRLEIRPMDEFSKEINEILALDSDNFPFEYYSIKFSTFADHPYSGYRKFLRHLLLDSSEISNEFATRNYIQNMYEQHSDEKERNNHKNQYRLSKRGFQDEILKDINDRHTEYDFSVRSDIKASLESDLTLSENGIPIEERGKGMQCFIKTEFALKKGRGNVKIDTILLEEPENHLSHVNMKKLIEKIQDSEEKQLIVASHNSLIATRLDLRNVIVLSEDLNKPAYLDNLDETTSKFFTKAPDNNFLEFVLSKKVILVEGDSEFLLMGALYIKSTGTSLESDNAHVISVDGTSFKRYMEVAKILGIKTAIIRDNDKNYERNCVERYADHISDNIRVFADEDDERYTFEICIYRDNTKLCDDLFGPDRQTLAVEDYMLGNKTESSFQILDQKLDGLVVPQYIKDACLWIRD